MGLVYGPSLWSQSMVTIILQDAFTSQHRMPTLSIYSRLTTTWAPSVALQTCTLGAIPVASS